MPNVPLKSAAPARESASIKHCQPSNSRNASARAYSIDLQDAAEIDRAEAHIRDLKLDILVCNSGEPPAGSATASDLREQFEVSRCVSAALPYG